MRHVRRARMSGLALLLLVLCLAGPAYAGLVPATLWRTEIISLDAFEIADEPGFAISDSGAMFVAWRDLQGTSPHRAYFAELIGGWIVTELPSGSSVASTPAVTVGPDGEPHAFIQTLGGLVHQWRAGAAWNSETVAYPGGLFVEAERGPDGKAHILFDTGGCVKYAVESSSGWSVETVTCSATTAATDLAIAPDGTPHVVYKIAFATTLQHASRVAGSWVATAVGIGDFPTIAIDSSGVVHIAYKSTAHILRYDRGDQGVWTSEDVAGAQIATLPSIAVDSTGAPHISYRDRFGGTDLSRGHLHYAMKPVGGEWFNAIIDREGIASHNTIRVDHTDTPRVVYYYDWDQVAEVVSEDLRYAEPLAAVPSRALPFVS